MSPIKMTKVKILIVLVALVLGAVLSYGNVLFAQTDTPNDSNLVGTLDILDPFSLTSLTSTWTNIPPPPTPILTLREWIHIPYSPPVRSPYTPRL